MHVCYVLGEIGLSDYGSTVAGPPSMPPLPAYNGRKMPLAASQGSSVPDLSSGQQIRNTGAQAILQPDLKSKTSGPLSMTRDVHAAVSNLAKLAEPLGGGDVVGQTEPTKADLGVAASGIQSAEMVRVHESTLSTLSVSSSASTSVTAADSLAAPDVIRTFRLGLNTTESSYQDVTPTESTAPVLTISSSAAPVVSGIALFGKPSVPAFSAPTQVATAAGFVFGQPAASTSSKLFGPQMPASGPGTAEQPTVSGSESASGQTTVVSTSAAVGDGDTSTVTLAPPSQPLPVPSTSAAETTANAASSDQAAVPPAGIDTVASAAITSTATTLFGQSVTASAVITSATPPAVVTGQPSTTVVPGPAAGGSPALPATSDGEPIASSVATASSTPTAVFGQHPAAATNSTAGTTLFGGSASTSATSSIPSVFGITAATTSSAGTTLFGQQPSSTSGLFGQQAPTPASVAASSIGVFGQPSVASSSSASTGVFGVFGQPSSTPASDGFKPFGFASSSSGGFGQTPSFGQSTFGQSTFGQPSSRSVRFILENNNAYLKKNK